MLMFVILLLILIKYVDRVFIWDHYETILHLQRSIEHGHGSYTKVLTYTIL